MELKCILVGNICEHLPLGGLCFASKHRHNPSLWTHTWLGTASGFVQAYSRPPLLPLLSAQRHCLTPTILFLWFPATKRHFSLVFKVSIPRFRSSCTCFEYISDPFLAGLITCLWFQLAWGRLSPDSIHQDICDPSESQITWKHLITPHVLAFDKLLIMSELKILKPKTPPNAVLRHLWTPCRQTA